MFTTLAAIVAVNVSALSIWGVAYALPKIKARNERLKAEERQRSTHLASKL